MTCILSLIDKISLEIYILRQFDEIGVDLIFSECIEEKGIGLAIMNRLKKAAGQHVIKVE